MAEKKGKNHIGELMEAAFQARRQAYCPYSNFHVGAAVLCEDGSIFTGKYLLI